MITGRIDENLEARLAIEILTQEQTHVVEFLLDTGFNGFLAIPMTLVDRLGLPLGEVQRGITADGRTGYFDTVRVDIVWNSRRVHLHAQVLDEPLIGVRLLRGFELNAIWTPNNLFTLNLFGSC